MFPNVICLVHQHRADGQMLAARRFNKEDYNLLNTVDSVQSDQSVRAEDPCAYEEFIWRDEFTEQQKNAVGLRFGDFVGDAVLVGHGHDGKLAETVRGLSGRSQPVLDTAVLARVFFPRQRHYSLESLWKALGPEPAPLTSPRDSAGAIGCILARCWQKALGYDIGYYVRVEPVVRQTIYRGFFARLKEAVLSYAPNKPIMTGLFAQAEDAAPADRPNFSPSAPRSGAKPSSERSNYDVPKSFQWVASCFAGDGLLAGALPGFESRQAQVVMSQSVVDAFDTGGHRVIEAETGTGKSMAYLLPALWWARLMGEKVVVATHTIPLQEQLFTKDLPFLAGVLPFTFQAALLKGRNNYICPLLLEQEFPREAGLTAMPDTVIPDAAVKPDAAVMPDAAVTPDAVVFPDAAMMPNAAVPGQSLAGTVGSNVLEDLQALVSLAAPVGQDALDPMVWPMLLSWLRETESGDFSEVPQLPQWNYLWQRLSADTALCMPGRCRYARGCFMLKARQRAQEADVIVINHSLLFSDMKAGMLPEYRYLIVDEAHNLYNSALAHLGFEVSCERLTRWLDKWRKSGRGSAYAVWLEASRFVRDLCPPEEYRNFTDCLNRCPSLAGRIEEQARQAFALFRQILGDRLNMRLTLATLSASLQNLLKVELENLSGRLEELDGALRGMQLSLEASGQLDTLKYEITRERAQLAEWVQGLRQTAVFDDDQRITYLEKSSSLWLKSAPLDIAAILKDSLFSQKETVILCSATLSVAGDFSYFLREIGLDCTSADTLVLKSHFDYQSQMLSCIVSGFSLLGDEAALAQDVAAFVGETARVVRGRTLVLFTSHRLLRLVNNALEGMAGGGALSEGLPGVLAQGIHGGRDALLDDFRANPERVLLGSSSFWEGIDLPKDELSCLIMVRLPFWPPSMPVIEARSELMAKKGQDPFTQLLLPEAVIRFKQGFGRLVRTRDDRGVFILLDDRLVTKKYGPSFLKSLPKRTHVRGTREQVLRRVGEFFDGSW